MVEIRTQVADREHPKVLLSPLAGYVTVLMTDYDIEVECVRFVLKLDDEWFVLFRCDHMIARPKHGVD